jgi:fatty-acid peroxygenase
MLDGVPHRHRKAMFLSLMGAQGVQRLAELTAAHWRAALGRWERLEAVVLFDEANRILCGAVMEWAGLPAPPEEVAERAREFAAMIDGTGSVGPRNWRGHLLRARTERWMREVIGRILSGELPVPEGSAADVVARHRDDRGRLLDERVAAVELINVLRPTVANGRYVAFIAHALHFNPAWRAALREGGAAEREAFALEVRRLYPFIPAIGGRVVRPFSFGGHDFGKDDWVLIDLYGTNRDPRAFDEPERFRPERFLGGRTGPLVSHGWGDRRVTHRCPGEAITQAQMEVAAQMLAAGMTYEVPEQDLRIRLSRMPALPESRMVLRRVRAAGAVETPPISAATLAASAGAGGAEAQNRV